MPTEAFAIVAAIGVQMQYSFTVDGSVSPTTVSSDVSSEGELVEDGGNVEITSTSTGYNVSGKTGGGFGDAFNVDGTIRNWSATVQPQNYTLRLDGDHLSATDFPAETGGQENRDPTVGIDNVSTSQSQVSAQASASDPDGNLTEVSWVLTSGGNQVGTATGNSVSFSISGSGTYTLTVTATDSEGATGQASTTFEVSGGGGDPPDDGNGGNDWFSGDNRKILLGLGAFGLAFALTGGEN